MQSFEAVVEGLRAVGEPTRLRLIALLSRAELTVSELTSILKQSQPRVSRHLKLLADSGLIERSREGTWVFYRACETGGASRLKDLLLDMISPQDATFFRDMERLDAVRSQRAAQAQRYFAAIAPEWDRLRALHAAESDVEQAILSFTDGQRFDHHLDIGTGTGRIIELMAPHCARGLGVDLNPEMLAIARDRISRSDLRKAQVRLADLFELPAADGSFDLVTIHQVLHYLEEPGRAVAEAARVLKTGGLLLIADFAPHAIEALRSEHQHRRLGFDTREVQGWFDAAGLTLRRVEDLAPRREDGLTVSLWSGARGNPVAPVAKKESVAT